MTLLASWLLSNTTKTPSPQNGVQGAGDDADDYSLVTIATGMAGPSPIKTKFLFSATFGLRSDINLTNVGNSNLQTIQYDLKTASRPNITINQEDINFYGYRSKVATKANFGTLQLVFYEDALDNAGGLLWKYINTISPISKSKTDDIASITSFDAATIDQTKQTIGALPNRDGIFKWIKVYHYYPKLTESNYGVTVYKYLNPKLESCAYDGLDMGANEASTVTLTFTADGITRVDTNFNNDPGETVDDDVVGA